MLKYIPQSSFFEKRNLSFGPLYPAGGSVAENSPPWQRPEAATVGECEAAPPVLLGGVKWQTEKLSVPKTVNYVGVHWLQGTIPHEFVSKLWSYFNELFCEIGIDTAWGRLRYANHYSWATLGVVLYFDSDADTAATVHSGRACVSVPGQALDFLGAERTRRLIFDLCMDYWFLATRIDVYFDDYARSVSIDCVWSVVQKGHVSGFRCCRRENPGRITAEGLVAEGDAVYLGRRGQNGGGKYLRIYDKNLESGGAENCIRWEVEFSKLRAASVCWKLAQSADLQEFGLILGSLVGGSVDFVVKSAGDRHLSRASRCDWWESIRSVLGSCAVKVPAPDRSVQQSLDWVQSQVSTTLAMAQKALGMGFWEWLEAVIDTGFEHLGYRHEVLLNRYFNQNGKPAFFVPDFVEDLKADGSY